MSMGHASTAVCADGAQVEEQITQRSMELIDEF
jgi:hypothetical protein